MTSSVPAPARFGEISGRDAAHRARAADDDDAGPRRRRITPESPRAR